MKQHARKKRFPRAPRRAKPEGTASASPSCAAPHTRRPDGLHDTDRDRIRAGLSCAIEHADGSAELFAAAGLLRALMLARRDDEVLVADALMTLNAFRIVAARGVMVRVLGVAA